MIGIEEHMQNCVEEDMAKCGVCQGKFLKSEFKDHLIAHNVQQQQVEVANVRRIAEIEEFFEEEKLDTATREPPLTEEELDDLPLSRFHASDEMLENETIIKCIFC